MQRTKPRIKVGDIVSFSGVGWPSIVVNLGSYGIPWLHASHIGIMGEYKGELLLFESTTLSNLPCVIRCEPFKGTQAVRLEDRVASYEGRIHHYPLYCELYHDEAARLNAFLIDHIGIPYDTIGAFRSGGTAWSWLESWLREEDLSRIFCSEFCAAGHREIGMMRTDNVSSWNPNKFIRHERWEETLSKPWRLK